LQPQTVSRFLSGGAQKRKKPKKFHTFIEPILPKNVSSLMKSILCFFLLSFSAGAQIYPFNQNPLISLPVYYFPFYDSVQIIEVDYYAHSLEEGALHDAMYPRGGSSY
jgi:hypothetical protein